MPRPLLAASAALAALLLCASPAAALTEGGINTGLPGSTCAPGTGGATYSPPGPGVTPNPITGAPAPHEVGEPTVAGTPKGVMIVLHGGAWHMVGEALLPHGRAMANRWRSRGWRTVNSTYGACAQSIEDVVALYDLVRERWPSGPICVSGASAGGHLALLLAARRPDVACVVSHAGPTDLTALLAQKASGTHWKAVAAFGDGALGAASPVAYAGNIRARLLLANAAHDKEVPLRQAQQLDAAVAPSQYSDLVTLDPGTTYYVHAPIHPHSMSSLHRRELNLVAPLVGAEPAECDICGAGAGWSRAQATAGSVVMSNSILNQSGTQQLGTLKATLKLTATGGSWAIPSTGLKLPAGRHLVQTCFGASGGTVTRFDKCIQKDVTLAAAGSVTTPAKTLGLARTAEPYSWYAAVFVHTWTNGAWVGSGGSWRGNHASRITVPPPGAAI